MGRQRKQTQTHENVASRRVDPAKNPGPRGNQDIDPRRMEIRREDWERAGAN